MLIGVPCGILPVALMADTKERSAYVPMLVVGMLLLGLCAGLILVPVFDCSCEKQADIEASRFIGGIENWPNPYCERCNDTGKVDLLEQWSGKDETPKAISLPPKIWTRGVPENDQVSTSAAPR